MTEESFKKKLQEFLLKNLGGKKNYRLEIEKFTPNEKKDFMYLSYTIHTSTDCLKDAG